MTIVIDASVALKWVLSEPGSEAAVALQNEQLVAPVLWLAEAANALWRRLRLGEITADEARAFLDDLGSAPVASLSMEPHLGTALSLAIETGHRIYDCIYLAIALHHRTHVVTADRRFVSAIKSKSLAGRVRLLGT